MNTQVFILLIVIVAIIRFFKGITSRNREINVSDEINSFVTQTIVTLVFYVMIYGVITLFN